MVFTEDGRYILSSAVGERYIVVWSLDEGKKQSASCVLAMEHPAIFVDSRRSNVGGDETALYILAISEIGVCYLWYGQNLEELRSAKPTKIVISDNDISSKSNKRAIPAIYAAKLQGVPKSGSGQVFLAHGLLVKPSFQNIVVQSGIDINLNSSNEGILLPSQSIGKSKKGIDVQGGGETLLGLLWLPVELPIMTSDDTVASHIIFLSHHYFVFNSCTRNEFITDSLR